jgi:hypothetical protein
MCSSGKSIQDSNSLDVDEGISDRGSDSEVDSKFKSVILNNSNNDNVMVSFLGGGNWSTQRKPLICCKSLTNFIT